MEKEKKHNRSFKFRKIAGKTFSGLSAWLIVLLMFITACEQEHGVHRFNEGSLTICEFIKENQAEFLKSHQWLSEGKMLNTLCGYNPYGDDYTLFLPTDEALNQFIGSNPDFNSFEEMLEDTGFVKMLTRYHTLSRKVHTDEFPLGALEDTTLTGERLAFDFYADGDNQVIKVNKVSPIITSNVEMTNGYIHVISKVLEPSQTTGYDWLQEKEGFSILAKAIEISGLKRRLWWDEYTILAEHDSIYHRNGIMNVNDLIDRIATSGSLSNQYNKFHQFAAYHFVGGGYYLNDLEWGNNTYWTMSKPLNIHVGAEIKINPGIDKFGITISETGDTTEIDYVRIIWEDCNNMTKTGPVHAISDLLFFEPFPE